MAGIEEKVVFRRDDDAGHSEDNRISGGQPLVTDGLQGARWRFLLPMLRQGFGRKDFHQALIELKAEAPVTLPQTRAVNVNAHLKGSQGKVLRSIRPRASPAFLPEKGPFKCLVS